MYEKNLKFVHKTIGLQYRNAKAHKAVLSEDRLSWSAAQWKRQFRGLER